MSDLVGNPEDRFSRVAAHIIFIIIDVTSGPGMNYRNLSEPISSFCNTWILSLMTHPFFIIYIYIVYIVISIISSVYMLFKIT